MDQLVASTLDKVDHIIDRIDAVGRGPLVQSDTADALKELSAHFQLHRQQLENFNANPGTDRAVIENHCDIVLMDLFRFLPHIGFLHRARHPSNPFEVHGPLKRLAQHAIDADVRLIISSEWEFSPYTHPSMGDIPNFVLLGLPASEADNALLVPIAGHEFGHPTWKRGQLIKQIKTAIDSSVLNHMRARLSDVLPELSLNDEAELLTNQRAGAIRADITRYVRSQCEEVFCDLFGLLLFGDSFCHAFAHLLAPGLVDAGGPSYPSARRRAEILEFAAPSLKASVPRGFADRFRAPSPKLWTDIMNGALTDQLQQLIQMVQAHASTRGLTPPTEQGRAEARAALQAARPATYSSTLPEIMCAGWDLWVDESLWLSQPHLREDRARIINDLVLKSAQGLEYWHLIEATGR